MTLLARRLTALAALVVLISLGALAVPAAAARPFDVVGEVTDQAGVLGERTQEVEAALGRLRDGTPLQLFVVYVDSFDELDGLAWANETAIASGLGAEDLLLAVAVQDRRFGISVADEAPLTDAWLAQVRTERIEPALAEEDWAGAAIAAADGYLVAYEGTDAGEDPGTGAGGSGSGLVTFLVIALVVIAIVVVIVLVRRRGAGRAADGSGRTGAPDDPRRLSTEELDRRAASSLVEIDDALRTSEQELGFAQAQFGVEATRAFAEALGRAKKDVARAFMLRQQVDDDTPESEPAAREMLAEVVETCERVSEELEDHAEEFARLRDLQARAPEVLAEVEARAGEVRARIAPARARLAQLAATYPAAALTSVAANPDQAGTLLDAARDGVAQGRAALAAGDRSAAVAHARVAEDAVAQAVLLLDSVDAAGQALATAGERLATALASISADIADAERLAPREAAVAQAVAVARTRVDEGRAAGDGGDPLTALRHLAEAEAALDAALAPAREHAEQAERANALLTDVVERVTAQVHAVDAYIGTRRGAVGPQARTRLAEAVRFLGDATTLRASEPTTALQYAQHAEALAGQAQAMAQQDVQAWEQAQRGGPAGYPGGGGLGGFGAGRGFGGGRGSSGTGALVLGGILLDRALRGGGGGLTGGGFGGGSLGGRRGGTASGGFGGGFGGGRAAGRGRPAPRSGGRRSSRGGGGRF